MGRPRRGQPEPAGRAGGHGREPFLPGQAISREAALAAYTSGSALINGLADTTGSIRPGLDADFAIVDADLATLPDGELWQAAVLQTWVRGQQVYARG